MGEKHIKAEHPSLLLKCTECEFMALSANRMRTHNLQIHVPMSERPYQCQLCHRGFLTPARYRKHLKDSHKLSNDELDKIIQVNYGPTGKYPELESDNPKTISEFWEILPQTE